MPTPASVFQKLSLFSDRSEVFFFFLKKEEEPPHFKLEAFSSGVWGPGDSPEAHAACLSFLDPYPPGKDFL
jgi:hypothetical protein